MNKIMFVIALLSSTFVQPMKKLNKVFKNLNFSSKICKAQPHWSTFFQVKQSKKLIRTFCVEDKKIKSFDSKKLSKVLLTEEKFMVVVGDCKNQEFINLKKWRQRFGDEKIKNEKIPCLDKDLETQDDINKFYAILFQEPVTKERLNAFVSDYGDYHNKRFIGLIFDLVIQSETPEEARECFLDVISTFINVCRSKNQISDKKIVKRALRIISQIAGFRREIWPLDNLENIIIEMLKPN